MPGLHRRKTRSRNGSSALQALSRGGRKECEGIVACSFAGVIGKTSIRALASRALAAIRTLWLIAGISLALVVALELAAGLVVRATQEPEPPDLRAKADCYRGAAWPETYFADFDRLGQTTRWQPFVYWRRSKFESEHIHIDERGVRRTWNPAGAASAREVFLFGGSTTWGTGARDDFTIPSLLSKQLAARASGAPCVVTNFGETGYMSSQEVITLEQELKRGHVPALAIFYDGVNDTGAAFGNRRAGAPMWESTRETDFLLRKRGASHRAAAAIRQLLFQTSIATLSRSLRSRSETALAPAEVARLAADTADCYRRNVRHVMKLAEAYRFRCLFYWQPVIFTKRSLTPYERLARTTTIGGSGVREMSGQYAAAYAAVAALALEKEAPFRNISAIFDDDPEPRYVDHCHVGEEANERIARRLFRDVERLVDD